MKGSPSLFYPIIVLFGLACIVYAPSLSGDFLLDDNGYITNNQINRQPRFWYRFLFDPHSHLNSPLADEVYRPVAALSFGINSLFGGNNPFWYHLVNVLLHAANTCLLFILALRFLSSPIGALGGALLFCLHPAQVESVAYLGSRAALLGLFFSLIGLLLYVRRDGSSPRIAAPLLVFLLALFSKETSVFLLPVVVVYDCVFRMDAETWRERWQRWAALFVVVTFYILARHFILGRFSQTGPWGGSWLSHWELSAHGWFEHVIITLWPMHLRECYSFVPGNWFRFQAGLITTGVVIGALWTFRLVQRRRLSGFSLSWIFAGFAPVSNLIPIAAFAADRFLYVPMVGIGLLWGQWLDSLKPRNALGMMAALSLLLAFRTLDQEQAWQSQFMLDLESYAAAPKDPCTSMRLSMNYYDWGMLERAAALLNPGISGPPTVMTSPSLIRMALVKMRAGQFQAAIPLLQRADGLSPHEKNIHRLMGECWLRLGNSGKAQEEFRAESDVASRS